MLNRTIAKFLFYGVAIILLVWTSSLTYSFLSMALPGAFWAVPLLGLVVFDAGMIAWMFVFLSHAEGAIQRAVAIILTLWNFLGVGLMTIAEILLSGQTLTEAPAMLGTAAIWGIGIWTVVNVLGVIVFHLGDPEARKEMAIQSEKDAIFEGALNALKNRRVAAQQGLADELSGAMFAQLLSDIRADSDKNGIPDLLERGNQPRTVPSSRPQLPDHAAPPVDDVALTAAIAALIAEGKLSAPVSNSTYDTARHGQPAQPGPGQGNGPAGHRIGGDANFQ